jgi:hypothetical protein
LALKRSLLLPAILVLLGCLACAEPPAVQNSVSLYAEDASRYGFALNVGQGLRTCGAVPVAPRLAVTALPCVRMACRAQSEEPDASCRLRFAGRNGQTALAKLALASESDALALIELGQRVPTWVPLGCKDPWPDETLYVYEPDGTPPEAPSGSDARMILTSTEARGGGGDWGRQMDRFAPPTRAPDLSVFIDSDRVRQLLAGYCARHPSRHCQEAGCRSAKPQPRATRRGLAAAEHGYGSDG